MIKIKYYTELEDLPDPKQNLLLQKHPFRLLITEPSGCGKTTLVINLLNGFEKPKNLRLYFDALYLCAKDINEQKYSTLQDIYTLFKDADINDIIKSIIRNKEKKEEYKKEI